MNNRSVIAIAVGITVALLVLLYFVAPRGTSMWGAGRFRGGAGLTPGAEAPATFASDGQRIYYTATSETEAPISFTGGPMWLTMHGGSCVSCHGPDGRGGYVVPMTDVTAPDIRYETLTSEEPMEGGHEEHPPYTEPLIKRAIRQGLDPAGHPLSEAMPRWHMSDRELDELVNYLKVLSRR